MLELGLTAHVPANCAFDWVSRDNPGRPPRTTSWNPKNEPGKHFLHTGSEDFLSVHFAHQKTWGTFPALTGIKAKQSPWLVPILAISEEFHNPQDFRLVHKHKCLEHLNSLCQVLDASPMRPSKVQAKSFKKHIDACLLHYCRSLDGSSRRLEVQARLSGLPSEVDCVPGALPMP